MLYRRLGNSGLKVSEISLGTWLTHNEADATENAIKIIENAYECGINFFDTSNVYSGGSAEIILGEALKKFERGSYVLATKVYWPAGEGITNKGLSRKHISEQVNKSLKRLGTDHIDLYYCHWFDTEVPLDETLRALDDLVRAGKIFYIGVSNWTAAQIQKGLSVCDHYLLNRIVANQPSYNLFDRFIEKDSLSFCKKNGIGQVVYSPLAQGVLTGKYRLGTQYPSGSRAANPDAKAEVTVWDYLNEELLLQVEKLMIISEDMGVSLPVLALAWVLRQPNVASALTGASKPAQIEENIKASGLTIPDDVLSKIDKLLHISTTKIKHNIIF